MAVTLKRMGWKNNAAPALSAENLIKFEDNIQEIANSINNSILVTTANTNVDDYIETGAYYFNGSYIPVGAPSGTVGWLIVFKGSSSSAVQQFWIRQGTLGKTDNIILCRLKSTAWGNWKDVVPEDSGWINITPATGVAGTGYYAPQYRKIGKQVYLRGYINNVGAEGTTILTLPTGFRPTNRIRLLSIGDYLESSMSIVRILESGAVIMFKTNSTVGYVNLDNISFLTD